MTTVLRVAPDRPDPFVIATAAACLREGGLVAFPTETVYGLGVAALDAAAVKVDLERLMSGAPAAAAAPVAKPSAASQVPDFSTMDFNVKL